MDRHWLRAIKIRFFFNSLPVFCVAVKNRAWIWLATTLLRPAHRHWPTRAYPKASSLIQMPLSELQVRTWEPTPHKSSMACRLQIASSTLMQWWRCKELSVMTMAWSLSSAPARSSSHDLREKSGQLVAGASWSAIWVAERGSAGHCCRRRCWFMMACTSDRL